MSDKQLREALGHNGAECRVRISQDGSVHRYGSPDPIDRSKDYWMYLGERAELARELQKGGS